MIKKSRAKGKSNYISCLMELFDFFSVDLRSSKEKKNFQIKICLSLDT